MRKFLLLIAMAVSSAVSYAAGNVTVRVEGPSIARIDEYFNVQFIVDAEPDDYSEPDFGGLDLVAGPITSFSRSMSWINGKASNTVSYIITYSLIASKEGVYTVGPMSVEVDGKTVKSKPYPIEVVKERTTRRSQGFASDDVLLRMVVSKTEVYKGEPVVATVYLYGLDKVASLGGATPPAFNGFWKQELSVSGAQPERVTFNGKVYDRMPVARYLLFPQKSGRLEVERMDVTAIVMVESSMQGPGSLLDEFMGLRGSVMEQREHRMTTSPVAVEVRELPSPTPVGFTGAVGNFGVSAQLSSLKIKANSSATLTVTVSGTGNLPTVAEPKPSVPGTFDLYPAKSSDDFSLATGGVSGSRTYTYPLIPRAEGRYTIEPVKFSYFDPATARYHTVATDPIDVEVLPDDSGASSGAIVGGPVKEDLAILGKDIHFIRLGDPKLSARDSFFVWSPVYVLVLAALAAISCGVLFYMRKRVKAMRDAVKVRNKRANKVALRRLKQSKAYMDAGKEALFYEEMMRALYGYVSDKLNIPVSDLSKDNIEERMAEGGISQTDITAMIKLLSDCEWARYSPGASLQMTSVYQASLDLIDRFESKL
ncbi:MAG: BatD family protein [Rikenellaceae bacterium]|nr:BatD family protein [Rikenellaceae bacterium]